MFRLSPTAYPVSYDLELRPNLDSFVFSGSVSIQLQIPLDTTEIELNSKDLEISSANLFQGETQTNLKIEIDNEHEILRLFSPNLILAGLATLSIDFSGDLRDDLAGFYRSSYTSTTGDTHYIATTQFESTDARKAFPCFDEPDLKATFKIHLVVPKHLEAISNYPVQLIDEIEPSLKRVSFQETMPISTYLVAFIVGSFQSPKTVTTESNVPIRVLSIEGSSELSEFAYEVGRHAVRFFEEWFQIPYPAPKLDLVSIPDFQAGAMENLGAVTFREALLLIDTKTASKAELERVADVICHEIAHMWFGDLATMKWWNGIWLNEAFATYMELVACDAFMPKWNRWDSFGTSRLEAMDVDAMPSTRPIEYPVISPADAEDMFDLLTYEKGASVLRMIEQYLGIEKFRSGVSLYLEKYRLANAETTDLWDCIEEASGQPMGQIMKSWVFQGGHPLITSSRSGSTLTIRQEPFAYLSRAEDSKGSIGDSWLVPLSIRVGNKTQVTLLTDKSLDLDLGEEGEDLFVNAGGTGVYRTRYEGSLRDSIVSRYSTYSVLERFNLISDTWALVLAEKESLKHYVTLLRHSKSERNPNVLRIMYSTLSLMHRIADENQKGVVKDLCVEIFSPIIDEFQLDENDNEPEEVSLARAIAFEALGVIGRDREISAKAQDLFRLDISGVSTLPPNLANPVLRTVATHGDDSDFAFMLDRYRNPRDPQDRLRNLYAITAFKSPTLTQKVAEMCRSEIRIQDAFIVLANLVGNPHTGDRAINFIFDNYEELSERFPDRGRSSMFRTISLLCGEISSKLAPEIFQFFEEHEMPTGRRTLSQQLERYRLNLRFRENYGSKITEALS